MSGSTRIIRGPAKGPTDPAGIALKKKSASNGIPDAPGTSGRHGRERRGAARSGDWHPGQGEPGPGEIPWSFENGSGLLGIFQSSQEAMIVCDADGMIRFWNDGAEALFGFDVSEALGREASSFLEGGWPFPDGGNVLVSQAREAVALRKDGSKVRVELSQGAFSANACGLRLIIARDLSSRLDSMEALKVSEEKHRQAREELQYRIRFENLITSISTHFIHLPSDRIDMGINYALHALGEFAEVDRCYIFLFSPDKGTVDNTHEWCSNGVEPQIGSLQGINTSRFPWFMEQIRGLQAIHVPNVSGLPARASAEREEFEREGIKSLAAVPMVHRGSLRGYLGFDSVHREKNWSEDNLQVLRMAGEIFINALERKKVDQALSEAKAKYLNIFENAVEGIFQTTPGGRFLGVNPALARILGYSEPREMMSAVIDIGAVLYVDPERRAEFVRILRERGRVTEFESQVRRKDGSVIWISENARAVRKADGGLDYCEGTVMDVTQRKRMEDQLIHGALHDSLTGLPNRTLLMERLGRTLERSRRKPGTMFAVMVLDLDRFKMINESMGHQQGDRMLVAFARRLEAFVPPGTTLARLGGDEFGMLVEDLKDFNHATILADRLQEALSMGFDLDGQEIYAAASIGIAVGSALTLGPPDLLRDAETAMHRAKAAGKGRYEVFDVSMHTKAVQMLTLETDLRKALERMEFRLHYQPIVSLEDSSLMGFEALIRWIHPKLGMVSPADFIPLAEDTGMIIPIGRWVLWQSCKQLVEWQRVFENGKALTMSVNLSGKQLQDMDLVRQIQAILKETGLDSKSLKLEVTESAIMENPERAAAILTNLRDMGIHLSLDDFGTGYSSLSYLHRFPFHNLKIDRSFVSKMEAGDKDAEIVKVINSLAKNLGMDVVAEGIETEGQWALLHRLACAYGQGYFFSKPLEEIAAGKLIASGGFAARGPVFPEKAA
jgi:diguanylate cyclase (GGDEF)-like protein/PAS domain S-box-containing protein